MGEILNVLGLTLGLCGSFLMFKFNLNNMILDGGDVYISMDEEEKKKKRKDFSEYFILAILGAVCQFVSITGRFLHWPYY
jgi:hypothetical protein